MMEHESKDRVTAFLKKKPLTYSAQRERVTVTLIIENRGAFQGQGSTSYDCWADINVELTPRYEGRVGRPTSVKWQPQYFYVQGTGFGGLFSVMQASAEAIAKMLNTPSSKEALDSDSIRRCSYDLEDQVVADFDCPEFLASLRR